MVDYRAQKPDMPSVFACLLSHRQTQYLYQKDAYPNELFRSVCEQHKMSYTH
ncbi:hypothetical protein DERF_001648 [Dermatophagoides farinae]|uniref:Uncharacterized protein n=1 Tax=Dermatophagoides farinae TaxID=6954 RepID=A0A922ICN7_DERFA|nr:hypothetical protein DERF_001648 [Dermatophagoides farinae]